MVWLIGVAGLVAGCLAGWSVAVFTDVYRSLQRARADRVDEAVRRAGEAEAAAEALASKVQAIVDEAEDLGRRVTRLEM